MGRPSKLTEKQWQEIDRRMLAGEQTRPLAREFGVSEATLRGRFSAQHRNVKAVANQLVSAEAALRSLPLSAQISALTLADDMRAIIGHLSGAGRLSAATSHRLTGLAHAKVQEIDDATPLDGESLEALKGISALTRLANEASMIPMNFLAANKDAAKRANEDEPVQPARVFVRVEDASRDERADADTQQATG